MSTLKKIGLTSKGIWKAFWQDEEGMGVVEIILIIVVLIGLVVIFKKEIVALVKTILSNITKSAKAI